MIADPGLQQECELRKELLSIVRMITTDVRKVNLLEALVMKERQAALDEVPEPGAGDILPGPEVSFPDVRLYDDGIKGGEGGGA